jgi:hypothetical protein
VEYNFGLLTRGLCVLKIDWGRVTQLVRFKTISRMVLFQRNPDLVDAIRAAWQPR